MRLFWVITICTLLSLSLSEAMAQIYVMNIDGSGLHEIAQTNMYIDTLNIAKGTDFLLGARKNNRERVFSIGTDGKNLTQLTPDQAPDAASPILDPDNVHVVFVEVTSAFDIYSIDRGWTNKKLLVHDGGTPSFSHDGANLVFTRQLGKAPNLSIVVFSAKSDGTGERPVSATGEFAFSPSFNPQDNQQIVFSALGGPDAGVFTIQADGTNRRLVVRGTDTGYPKFTPDGARIVYAETDVVNSKIQSGIYVVNSDGSNPRNLISTSNMAYTSPVVTPDGSKIYFVGISTTEFVEADQAKKSMLHLSKQVSGSGCIEAGIEAGCFVLHDLKTGTDFNLFFKSNPPQLDTAGDFEGTENNNPNICMQGRATDVTKWTPIRLHCPQTNSEEAAPTAVSSQCKGWYAWYNVQPTEPKTLHLSGMCTFPTSGYAVKLVPRVPGGINPQVYIFDLIITPPKGRVSNIPRHIPVHYVEKTDKRYDSIEIEPDHVPVPVHIIQ